MAYPEFDPGKRKLLFFSRGNGRGHAIPDLEIADRLAGIRDDVDIRFASYGTGAQTIEEFGRPLIHLDLPERNGIAETTVLAGRVIGWLNPDLVVAHEEFTAMPAAKIFSKPTLMITDWFTDPWKYSMEALRFADNIVFIDDEGVFDEPEWVRGRVKYVGPVLRKFEYRQGDRDRAREELSLPADALVLAMLPGSWTEEVVPVSDLLIAAYDLLPGPKRMIWLAGADREMIAGNAAWSEGIDVRKRDWQIDRIMAACDVALTKSNRKTLIELNHLGTPAISFAHGHNAMDERRARTLSGNRMVATGELDAAGLANAIREAAAQGWGKPKRDRGGAARAAKIISAQLPFGGAAVEVKQIRQGRTPARSHGRLRQV